jgi:hypothetical protein
MSNELFSLKFKYGAKRTNIVMSLATQIVNTRDIPATHMLLEKYLPSVFLSKCFNEQNFPFKEEAKKTEIGHLFEHILLEYLCSMKKEKGHMNAIHNGVTHWNWEKDKWGVFHITIDLGSSDKEIFEAALEESVKLLLLILKSTAKDMVFGPIQQTDSLN